MGRGSHERRWVSIERCTAGRKKRCSRGAERFVKNVASRWKKEARKKRQGPRWNDREIGREKGGEAVWAEGGKMSNQFSSLWFNFLINPT